MIECRGDIVAWMAKRRWAVVPTNIGWKKDGRNPMGVGVAAAASNMYKELAMWYGMRCRKYGENTAVCPYYPGNLILFPTKPLDVCHPHASWRNKATIDLVARSAIQLQKLGEILVKKGFLNSEVAIPLVGCGAGGLPKSAVVSILQLYLDDRFVLVEIDDDSHTTFGKPRN